MKTPANIGLAALLGLSGCAGLPSGPLSTTAQRTTATSDTASTPAGALEFELGSVNGSADLLEVPLALKLGLGPATDVSLQGVAHQRSADSDGQSVSGLGDFGLGLLHRFADEAPRSPSLAFELFAKLPTADAESGLGSGELDLSASLLAAKNLGWPTLFARAQVDALGQSGGQVDLQHTLAASLTFPFSDALSVFTELAGSALPETGDEQLTGTVGVAWTFSESGLLEIGVRRGLLRDSTADALLVGLTWNFGRIL